jgi:hypothetical protein
MRCSLENSIWVDTGLFGNGQLLEIALVIQGVDVSDRPEDCSVSDVYELKIPERSKWLQVVDCAGDRHNEALQLAALLETIEGLNSSTLFEVKRSKLRAGR